MTTETRYGVQFRGGHVSEQDSAEDAVVVAARVGGEPLTQQAMTYPDREPSPDTEGGSTP